MVAGHLQVKKNYYYMVLNFRDERGNRKPKWIPTGIQVGGKKNEKIAQDMLLEARCSYKEAIVRATEPSDMRMNSNMLFADYMLSWLSIIKNSVEEVTYAGYEINIKKRIDPYFRKLKVTLADLTALDIEAFYEYCFNDLKVKGSTVQHFHANLHKALKYAVRHDLISANPMEKVDRPKSRKFVGSFYSLEEVDELFKRAKGDPVEFPILMAAFYGLRRSEIMGLRWQSIDFSGNSIMIDHTVVQFRSEGQMKVIPKDRTKNESSCRSLPLVPQFRELLLRMKERQNQCRKLCGSCYIDSGYIYVNDLGIPYKPNFVTQHFKVLLKKNGLRDIRFHDLRHTCASLLLKNGVSMKEIQEWLGHSDYSTTANIYAHLDTTSKNTSASKMTGALSIDPGISASF